MELRQKEKQYVLPVELVLLEGLDHKDLKELQVELDLKVLEFLVLQNYILQKQIQQRLTRQQHK